MRSLGMGPAPLGAPELSAAGGAAAGPGTASAGAALGIDTSAYTTSVALVGVDGQLLADARTVLAVPAGSRGLRQSEAVFQHIRRLPELMERVMGSGRARVMAVAASTAPRPVPDSYMPVFKAGEAVARAVAAALGVPFVPLSHQEGHVWAGLWSDRKSTRLNSSHVKISYAVFCLKKKNT